MFHFKTVQRLITETLVKRPRFRTACLRIVLAFLMSFLLSACAGLSKNTDKPLPADTATASTDTDQAQPQDGAQQLKSIPDPMKKDLPLGLIKGYDDAQSLSGSKNYSSAIDRLNKLQQEFPKYSGPSYLAARIYWLQKDYENVIKNADASLVIEPKNYYALNLKGIALREQGEFAKAKEAYLAAIGHYPANPESHLNLAILADIYMYDLPLALTHYENYLALITQEDRKVSGWVIDLKRRMPASE